MPIFEDYTFGRNRPDFSNFNVNAPGGVDVGSILGQSVASARAEGPAQDAFLRRRAQNQLLESELKQREQELQNQIQGYLFGRTRKFDESLQQPGTQSAIGDFLRRAGLTGEGGYVPTSPEAISFMQQFAPFVQGERAGQREEQRRGAETQQTGVAEAARIMAELEQYGQQMSPQLRAALERLAPGLFGTQPTNALPSASVSQPGQSAIGPLGVFSRRAAPLVAAGAVGGALSRIPYAGIPLGIAGGLLTPPIVERMIDTPGLAEAVQQHPTAAQLGDITGLLGALGLGFSAPLKKAGIGLLSKLRGGGGGAAATPPTAGGPIIPPRPPRPNPSMSNVPGKGAVVMQPKQAQQAQQISPSALATPAPKPPPGMRSTALPSGGVRPLPQQARAAAAQTPFQMRPEWASIPTDQIEAIVALRLPPQQIEATLNKLAALYRSGAVR